MKTSTFLSVVFLLLFICGLSNAHGLTLSLISADSDLIVGDDFKVELWISELEDHSAPSLSTFDIDILFDPTTLSIDTADVTFGSGLDVWGLGTSSFAEVPVAGFLNLWELSLDAPDDLVAYQASSFILSTMTFNAIDAGAGNLLVGSLNLRDEWGDQLIINTFELLSYNVTESNVPIPEPASMLLIVAGLLGLGVFSRRRIQSS